MIYVRNWYNIEITWFYTFCINWFYILLFIINETIFYMPEENLIQIINDVNIFICLSPTQHDLPLADLSHQSILLHLQVINAVILPKSLKLKSINCVFNYKMNRGLEACFIVITLINSRINIINLEREGHFPTRHDWNQFLSFSSSHSFI